MTAINRSAGQRYGIMHLRDKLKDICDNASDLIWVTAIEGNLLFVNLKWRQKLGYSLREALTLNLLDITQPDCRDALSIELENASSGDGVENLETYLLTKDGRAIRVEGSLKSWFDEDGTHRIRGLFRDISESRMSEKEALKAKKIEALSILAGGLGHDYNNILMGILGNISYALSDLVDDEKLSKVLEEAQQATLRAKKLTSQLMTLSKGGWPIKKIMYLQSLIRENAIFSLRGSKIGVEFREKAGLWPAEVDESQIGQVISNLIINAKQAMPHEGIIQIKVENHVLDEESEIPLKDGRYIRIAITDKGLGIEEKDISKVFDPYFSTRKQGAGLGLAIVYSIIQKHDGYIGVESIVGVGTNFTIYLPAADPIAIAEDKPVSSSEVSFPQDGRILLMDDDEGIREVTGRMMESLGLEVAYALDGAEAVRTYRKAMRDGRPFDAVVMDLTIPGGMGGAEAIERLLKVDPDVKAIVSSGYFNDPVMADYKRYGFKAMVAKPYQFEEMKQALHQVLSEAGITMQDSKEQPITPHSGTMLK